ncbi:uncharacterized protein DUF998 [Kribbella amoyensis]|uniref:Uncharacterized protein DUF998 n=1 Tax=Kribbella amoyensis TaxID=996641 RepID=A0A561BVI3_9ACTN|nr:DUF998 domain-containing protein [Kribbella amoyensis]TWD82914.1 uncharacterized protein DUF998 [Kribbella amoyensis]
MASLATTTDRDTTQSAVRPSTRHLLTAAALAGPLFFTSAAAQGLTRDGFDLRIHPISQLATGDLGWIQMATFVLAGSGVVALAVAYRRLVTEGVGRRLVPLLLTVFGAGLILAGLFVMDPQHGFPIGTPDGPAAAMSWNGIVHSAAAAIAFTALAVACIALVVRCVRRRQVAAAVGHGVVAVVLLVPMPSVPISLQIAFTGLIAFTWTTVTALRLRRRS